MRRFERVGGEEIIELDIALVSRDAHSLGRRLASLGRTWPLANLREVTAARHHACFVEQALLPGRGEAATPGARRGGLPAGTGALARLRSVPVVLVLDAAPELPTPVPSWIDDVVAPDELDSAAFLWRFDRLVQRYRRPLEGSLRDGPESAVLRAIVDHSSDWLIVKDLEHRFLLFGKEFSDIVGMPANDILGRDDLDIGTSPASVHGDAELGYPGFWAQDDAVVASGEAAWEDNPEWRLFSHSKLYKRTERVPLRNAFGEVVGLLVRVCDITEAIRAEQRQAMSEALLQKATDEMLDAQRSKRLAEEAIAAKNRFMAAASHDLRQPLHALGLFLGLLDSRLDAPEQRALLTKIQQSTDALSDLFNSLLDMSKLDAGVVEVDARHAPAEELLTPLRDDFVALGTSEGLEVGVERCDAVIHTDVVLFGRILRNLMQNAIVHTEEGSVRVSHTVRDGRLRIAIVDTGPGIPGHEHEHVFSEFYQLHTQLERATRGLGLGLPIVKRLATLLDVGIELESTVGVGTTFTVDVALGDPAQVEGGDPYLALGTTTLVDRRVLVVDDEPDIREGLREVLVQHGCRATTAATAAEAIASLEAAGGAPDVMVADYRLRDGDKGSDAIAHVRRHFGIAFPAVIVTGDTSAERMLEARGSGFPLLHKPVRPADLLDALVMALGTER